MVLRRRLVDVDFLAIAEISPRGVRRTILRSRPIRILAVADGLSNGCRDGVGNCCMHDSQLHKLRILPALPRVALLSQFLKGFGQIGRN